VKKRGETQDEAIAMEEQTAGMSEEDAERERVLSRVRIIMPIATIPHELEVAIRAAIDAGVQSEQLHDAERRVQLLRARASAHDQLLVAIATRAQGPCEKQFPVLRNLRSRAARLHKRMKSCAWKFRSKKHVSS